MVLEHNIAFRFKGAITVLYKTFTKLKLFKCVLVSSINRYKTHTIDKIMDTLKFDEAAVNTDLAKEYLKNNQIFKSEDFSNSKESASNEYQNIIYFSEYKRTSGSMILCHNVSEVPKKLYNLAKKIEENVHLFCQLELLIRNIPLEDTKNIDLQMITQNLIHYSSANRPQVAKTTAREIVVCKDSSLLPLGCVAQVLMARMPRVVIECTKETAPVCSLFTDLCHAVGLKEKVLLAILPRISETSFNVAVDFGKITDFQDGGIGIVSGISDVDSAVDTLLGASYRYPWALKKIFVQECVFERFKRSLSWRMESGGERETWFWRGDKMFSQKAKGGVSLEAYRTVRELLSLLGALRPLAASLWSSDVAESLEIAHGLSAALVWVNNFADCRGPPRASQAFYSVVDYYFSTQIIRHMPEFDEIIKFRESWLRFGIEERKDCVINALNNIDNDEASTMKVAIETLTFETETFVYVAKDVVATGVELLPEIMVLSAYYYYRLDLSIICYIIKGGAVLLHIPESVLKYKKNSDFYMFYENLRSMGAPVLFTKEDYKLGNIPILQNPIYRHKVIWTNYGTIFAN